MEAAQRLWHEFEDVVTIGALSLGSYREDKSLVDFSSRVFAVFTIAAVKRITIPEADADIANEAQKIRDYELREAFISGCKSRRQYRKWLSELNVLILTSDFSDHSMQDSSPKAPGPKSAVELAELVVKSPWFGGFARSSKSYHEHMHDPSIDFEELHRFWSDLGQITDIRSHITTAMSEVCQELVRTRSHNMPLIASRRVLLYELCDYWMEHLAPEELSHVYGALRKRWSPTQPMGSPITSTSPHDQVDDNVGNLPFSQQEPRRDFSALSGTLNEKSAQTWDIVNWYTSLPLPVFQVLLDRCKIAARMLLEECNPDSEDISDYQTTLRRFGCSIRSCMIHLAKLIKSNDYRRLSFEEELLDPQFWVDKRPVEDLDPDTLELLRTARDVPSDETPAYYLENSAFYVDPREIHLELESMFYFKHGQSILGIVLCSGCLSPLMKKKMLALDSKQQQLDRGSITALGPIFFMHSLRLTIRRDQILNDALDQLVSAQIHQYGEPLKNPLKIKFEGEEGVDEGGVTKEFFQLLIEKILDPNYAMFIRFDAQGLYYFMPNAYGTRIQFELFGIVLGLAVYHNVNLDIHFPHFIYKKLISSLHPSVTKSQPIHNPVSAPSRTGDLINSRLLHSLSVPDNEKLDTTDLSYVLASGLTSHQIVSQMATTLPQYRPSLEDMQELYPDTARGMRQLLMMTDPNVVDALSLTFSIVVERFDQRLEVLLKKNDGITEYEADKPVTFENRAEYIKAVLNYHLVFSIEKEFAAFYKGFHRCCGGPMLARLTANDLHLLICGAPGDLDFESLKAGSRYVDGYVEDSDVIKWFWEVADSLTQEEKKNLLFFMTGSDRTPLGGLESLQLTISKAGGDLNRLPTAHTCFNHLLLPEYESKEVLETFLRKAMEYRHGFGLR